MYLITVVPVVKGILRDPLSFFSKEHIEKGVVVDAPIRGKKTPAIVLETREVREEKSALRSQPFSLKKISPYAKRRLFSEGTVRAMHSLALTHGISPGHLFAHLTPASVIAGEYPLREIVSSHTNSEVVPEILALQADYEERVRTYRNVAREGFAKGESTFVLCATLPEAERLFAELSRGIENSAILATSALSKKNTVSVWNRAIEDPEPLLIVGTHSFLALPLPSLKHLIVERESARAFVSLDRARVDFRVCAEHIAREQGARAIYADFPLRVETVARVTMNEVEYFARPQHHFHAGATPTVIDMRKKKDTIEIQKKNFTPLDEGVMRTIQETTARKGRVFVYTTRRGIAPLTVCNSCGTPVTDPSTGTPMTLKKTKEGTVFVSFRSGAVMSSNISCQNCGSWDLVSLGVGSERVYEYLEKNFPREKIFLLTADTAPTHAKAKKIMNAFFDTAGAILIGTERAVPYLKEPVETAVIASIDSMLSLGVWRADAYAVHALFTIQNATVEHFLLQTRMPDARPIRAIATGKPSEYSEGEMEDRRSFLYPPFAVFIGLSWQGSEPSVQKISDKIKEVLTDFEIVGPLPPEHIGKRQYRARAVLRLERGGWPNARLSSLLSSLPLGVSVTIDPDEIV